VRSKDQLRNRDRYRFAATRLGHVQDRRFGAGREREPGRDDASVPGLQDAAGVAGRSWLLLEPAALAVINRRAELGGVDGAAAGVLDLVEDDPQVALAFDGIDVDTDACPPVVEGERGRLCFGGRGAGGRDGSPGGRSRG
jgi:hypothetical protein